jgi:ABC-type phosphate transport system substrate-binding protein
MPRRGERASRRDRTVGRLLLAAVLCALAASRPLWAADVEIRVIVHPRRAAALTAGDVRAIYLKQKLYWADGQAMVAINRESGSQAREQFSTAVFGQGSRRMADYWNRRYFDAGEFPPATLASDDAVVRFVASNPNAIGYVLTRDLDESVAVVLVIAAPSESP